MSRKKVRGKRSQLYKPGEAGKTRGQTRRPRRDEANLVKQGKPLVGEHGNQVDPLAVRSVSEQKQQEAREPVKSAM